MDKVRGVVDSVVWQAPEGTYCVLRIENKKMGRFTAVYRGAAPYTGEEVELEGEWTEHPRFGHQLQVQLLKVVEPTTLAGIERFLASGVLKGVGVVMAHRIVEMFGKETLEILEQEPDRLAKVKGISAKRAAEIGRAYSELSGLRELMVFLTANGVSSHYATKLQEVYGNTAIVRIQENPYCLASDVRGIGFRTADRIAMSLGMERDCLERLEAGLAYTLDCAAKSGHTCVPEEKLISEAAKVLTVSTEQLQEVFNDLVNRARVRTEEIGETRLVYPEYLYRAELGVAKRLLLLRDQVQPLKRVNADKVIHEWEREAGIVLAEEQRQAIHASLKYGVFVLTGGPGTGKTTVVKGILNVLRKGGCRILLAAPTGRAARRLAESSGQEAKTVHRLLEYAPSEDGFSFGKNDEEPLDAEAIIVDEASMLDITLTYHLLKAVQGGTRVIFVGDVDQLPSVGPGSVLKDMIRSKQLPVVRLENVFRQAEVSSIVRNAHAINHGRMPKFDNQRKGQQSQAEVFDEDLAYYDQLMEQMGAYENYGDFESLSTTKPQLAPQPEEQEDLLGEGDFQLMEYRDEEQAASYVTGLYHQLMKDYDYRQVQVLSPMHKQVCGVQNLNKMLQEKTNPPQPGKGEISVMGNILRLGDKVMQIRNNYEKDVFNGDIGRIVAVEGKNVTVEFPDKPDGERVTYAGSELEELQLAYAMSVHKSQGSEYPIVILLMVSSHYVMLQRNLLYTAVTRAKQNVIIVGNKGAVLRAVENDKTRRRYSLLAERLQEERVL